MKKILLTGINSRFSHPNLALYCLRSYISDLEFNVEIMEFTISQDTEEILVSLARSKPRIIGLSVYIWNVEKIKEVLLHIKRKIEGSIVILGGPEVSYDPHVWIENYPSIDFIITGGGEEGLRDLLLGRHDYGSKILEGRNPHFSKLPFPYAEEDFRNLKNRNIYYEASRGCPHKCAYCISSRSDQQPEFRDLDAVREEIDIIASHNPRMVKFLDRTFNAKKSFYRPVWDHILGRYGGSGIRFHFEIFPGLFDEDDFMFFSRCPRGLFQFEVGIQSTCGETLSAIGRNMDWEAVKPGMQRLAGLGNIHIHADLVAGLPYEDLGSMKRSFNEIYGLKCGHFQLGMLKVLKGTRLFDDAGRYGITFSGTAPYVIRSNKWLNEGEVEIIFSISRLIDTLYNTHNFEATLEGLEGLYPSYFDLYAALADFIKNHYSGERNKVWDANAARILKFISIHHPGEEEYFRDLLSWDWSINSRHNYSPVFLRHEDNKRIKKSAIRFFMQHSRAGTIQWGGAEFSAVDLKRSVFFKPGTDRFIREKMEGNTMALVLPGKDIIHFTM